jgi:hypothetical protein
LHGIVTPQIWWRGSLLVQWRALGKSDASSGPLLAWILLALGGVWIALFLVRIHAHQANVDDYLYASVTRGLTRTSDPVSALLHTGQNSPLVPLLAMPGVRLFGVYGGIFVDLPLLLLLGAGSFVLARRWLSPFGAAITALGVGLNAAVLGYAVMFNFALACTTAVVWCFAAYVRSERFRNWPWSIAFGLAFAALILSRSIAPVYALSLLLVVVIDVVVAARRLGSMPGWPALAAAVTVLVIAGPWWAVSGRAMWHYLTYAGYQASSGETSRGLTLTPASVVDRVTSELRNLGWAEAVVLGLLVLAALWQVVRDRRARQIDQLWIPAAWVVVALLVLSSSGNRGTAFGLPLIVVTIVVCAVVLGRTVDVGRRVLPAILVVLVCAGAVSQFTTSTNFWWPGPPYRLEVIGAGGSARINVDAVTASVARALPPGNTITAMNAAIINGNSLGWYAPAGTHILVPTGSSSTRAAQSLLDSSHSLVTGSTLEPFIPSLDQSAVESAAFRSGYRPTRIWKVSNFVNVIVWTRSSKSLPAAVLRPVVRMVRPHDGSTLHGKTDLVAGVSGVLGVSHATFDIRGSTLAHPVSVAAAPVAFAWVSVIDTDNWSKGTYTITCQAESVTGAKSTSSPITVEVDKVNASRHRGKNPDLAAESRPARLRERQ